MSDWYSLFEPAVPAPGDNSVTAITREARMKQAVHAMIRHDLKKLVMPGKTEKETLNHAFRDLKSIEKATGDILDAERSVLDKLRGRHDTIDVKEARNRLDDPGWKEWASAYAFEVASSSEALGALYGSRQLPSALEVVQWGHSQGSPDYGHTPKVFAGPGRYELPSPAVTQSPQPAPQNHQQEPRVWQPRPYATPGRHQPPRPPVQQWSAAAWVTSPPPPFSPLRRTNARRRASGLVPAQDGQGAYPHPPKRAAHQGYSQ
jgi:hypothetical protein